MWIPQPESARSAIAASLVGASPIGSVPLNCSSLLFATSCYRHSWTIWQTAPSHIGGLCRQPAQFWGCPGSDPGKRRSITEHCPQFAAVLVGGFTKHSSRLPTAGLPGAVAMQWHTRTSACRCRSRDSWSSLVFELLHAAMGCYQFSVCLHICVCRVDGAFDGRTLNSVGYGHGAFVVVHASKFRHPHRSPSSS